MQEYDEKGEGGVVQPGSYPCAGFDAKEVPRVSLSINKQFSLQEAHSSFERLYPPPVR